MRGKGFYYVKAIKPDGTEDHSFVGVCGSKTYCKKLVCGKYGYRHNHPNCDFVLLDSQERYVETIAYAGRTKR